jgi:hypothetical protein
MGGLTGFQSFVMGRRNVLKAAEDRLCVVQTHYEGYFAQIGQIKETELDQLETLVQQRRSDLPAWLSTALQRVGPEVEAEIDAHIQALAAQSDEQTQTAENLREHSLQLEREVHERNVQLDGREEDLKTRNEALLARIDRYNGKIREMSGGFGFFYNLFDARKLKRERIEIDREQADVAAHIENLRELWKRTEAKHAESEEGRRQAWQDASNLAAQLQTRMQWLIDSRGRVVYRTTLERAMADDPAPRPSGRSGDKACPGCGYGNPGQGILCQACGARLGEDRQDLEGSLAEIAAAVQVHDTFTEGMAASQQLIGLVRGLISGHDAFAESVQDMIDTQTRHPVSVLEIDVPERSVAYAELFAQLRDSLGEDRHEHPLDFAARVEKLLEGRLSEETISDYFEGMGEALSAAADAQW